MNRYEKQHHTSLMERGMYFAWNARKGSPSAGCDPMTGLAKSMHDDEWCAAGRASSIAQARVFFRLARNYRQLRA